MISSLEPRTTPAHTDLQSSDQGEARQQPVADEAHGLAPATRASIAREEAAIQNALTRVVGPREAERLLTLAEAAGELPAADLLPERKSTAWTRATRLAQTPEGRAKLRALTWDTV